MYEFLTEQTTVQFRFWIDAAVFFVGVLVGFLPRLNSLWRGFITYIHEMGHAFAAIISGRKVRRIKVRLWIGGHTDYVGPRGIGNIFIAWSGYSAPATVLFLMAFTLYTGYINFAASVGALVIFLSIFLHRTLWGVAFSILSILLLWGFAQNASEPTYITLYAAILGIILGAGARSLITLYVVRMSTPSPSQTDPGVTDSEALQRMTIIPARAWELSWWSHAFISLVVYIVVIYSLSRNGI